MNKERRKHKRISVNIPSEVSLVLPEDTFQPRDFQGTILDISYGGVKVVVKGLEKELFKKLLRPQRYMKLRFFLPGERGEVKLIGRIVYLNYFEHEKKLVSGIAFEEMNEEMQARIRNLISYLEREEQYSL
ncbi:PilZ domain-containing protein [Candidatus Sumerlaeota bacterium]|nr:PilZ domain-containing protein [Candidatus Sumerlaeota bacterium]